MPEELFGKIKKSIRPQWYWCFFAALVVGLVAHLYKVTNWLPNWDSLVFRYDPQNMLSIGRWFLSIASAPSSYYDLPWLTGLVSIVFHALGAVCICRTFAVEKKTTAALIGAVVVSFPTVTSVLMYNYVADAYALSFLLACVAAMLLTGQKPRYLLAGLCLTLSVGIYQAYVTVTVMLLLGYLILETLRRDSTVKSLLIKSGKFLLTGIGGMALYYAVLMVALQLTSTTLLEYQGFDGAASLSGLDVWGSLHTIKESFMGYFFDFSDGIHLFGVLNVVVAVFTVILYVADAIRNRIGWLKAGFLCVYAALLPIGASILAFVNSGVDYHNLMKMGFCVFYLFLILQYEKASFGAAKLWAILGVITLLVGNQTVIANVSYHKLNMAYEKSYGTLIRLVDRIEQTEGTETCTRLLVAGAFADSEAYSAVLPPDMTGTTDGLILRADDEIVGQSVLCSAINDYCGKAYTFVAGEEKVELLQRAEVADMSCWPAQDSVCVIDDVIVIKLS